MIRALILTTTLLAGTAFAAPFPKGGHHRPPAAPEVTGLANLNTANVKQLSLLPGVGKSRAKAIVAYRSGNAHFTKVDDVRKVKGVGQGVLQKLAPHASVSGPNTIAKVESK